MRDSLNIYEQIDNYLSNNMSVEELVAFKNQLTKNAELQQMVDNQQLIIQAQQRKVLRSEIEMIAKGGGFPFGKVIIGVGLLIVAVTLYLLIWNNVEPDDNVAAISQVEIKEVSDLDSAMVEVVKIDTCIDESTFDSTTTTVGNSTTKNNNYSYDDDTECGGHKTWVAPTIQKHTINPRKGATIEGEQGMLIIVPKNAFIDEQGDVVKSTIELELVEALTLEDMVLYNLATLSNGKQLESGGMFYLDAKSQGETVQINPERPLYIEIPTNEVKSGMMAFKGEVDEEGALNWVEPQPLKKYLAKVDLNNLDFLPEGFDVAVEDGMPFKGHKKRSKKLVDSLYYSLSSFDDVESVTEEVANEDVFTSIQDGPERFKGKDKFVKNAKISGKVVDEKGNPIVGAYLSMFSERAGGLVGTSTQTGGEFSFINVFKYAYLIRVKAEGYLPYAADIDLKGDYTKTLPDIVLKIDNSIIVQDSISVLDSPGYSELSADCCGIEPLSIKTIRTKNYANTYVATQEFEKRIALLHKINNGQELLDVYLSRLGEDMYISDSIVMTKVNGDFKTVFSNFYKQKLTNLKDAEIHQEQLSAYYNKKKKDYAKSVKALRNELNKKDLEEIKGLTDQLAVARDNYQSTLKLNSSQGSVGKVNSKRATSIAKMVAKFPKRNVVNSPGTYSIAWASMGWANIDSYLHMLAKGSEDVEILATNGDEGTQVYQWLNAINTLTPLIISDGIAVAKFPKRGSKNAHQMKNTFCFAISKKNGVFKWFKKSFNPYQSNSLKLEMSTTELSDIKNQLRILGVKQDNVLNHLSKIEAQLLKAEAAKKERERKQEEIRIAKEEFEAKSKEINAKINAINMKREEERLFIESLRQIAFPCLSEGEKIAASKVEPEVSRQVIAPAVYSPNGDRKNIGFLPTGDILLTGRYTFRIINSKSDVVYLSNNGIPWNGKLNNTGKWCSGGDYVWEVTHRENTGKVNKFKGNLLLLAGEE